MKNISKFLKCIYTRARRSIEMREKKNICGRQLFWALWKTPIVNFLIFGFEQNDTGSGNELEMLNYMKQESIPVGCIPTTP